MIPLSGVLMRWLSTRVAFVISCAGFTLASLGCALATSIDQLIVLRAIQGFMGGAMIPLTQAVSFSLFPRRAMGTVQGIIGMVVTLAPSIGPTVGGYLTEIFSWHWLFLVNVIPGIFVTLAVWRFLDVDKGDASVAKRLDFSGLILIALFLGSLEFVLEEGPGDDWFSSELIVWMTLLCVSSCIGFFWRVLTCEHPIVDLRAFKNLNFSIGTGLVFVVGIAMYGLVYLMPLFLGGVRGYSSLQIGEVVHHRGGDVLHRAGGGAVDQLGRPARAALLRPAAGRDRHRDELEPHQRIGFLAVLLAADRAWHRHDHVHHPRLAYRPGHPGAGGAGQRRGAVQRDA
ncbi:DHA2 family efflux MFS transporter permease subunit [Salinicola tamaricis]|uniref:DHA2 family efflux MFS transporter permease subunit n=1 Tax=Salinicola tamaricis TaxID=1771309 RepID=UPI001F5E2113|nr:DHA2 family efflux MFS transporter permease subunit [Salinicola tamaricis]